MLYYVVGTVIQFSFACHQYVACRSYSSGSNTSNRPPYRKMYLSDNRNASPLITSYTLAYIGRLYTTLQIFNRLLSILFIYAVADPEGGEGTFAPPH